jgi:hypothetical protein
MRALGVKSSSIASWVNASKRRKTIQSAIRVSGVMEMAP